MTLLGCGLFLALPFAEAHMMAWQNRRVLVLDFARSQLNSTEAPSSQGLAITQRRVS